ncbi:outer membrane protein transport protein [Deltaproteobacteria bacterium TL4]
MLNFKNTGLGALLFLVGLNVSVQAGPQDYYKNILVGDRAATMGGAYVAISDDASAGYYNPSGMVFAYGSTVSGSAIANHQTQLKYKNVFGDKDWDRESEASLPNFFGLVQKVGRHAFGFSYIVPESVIENQDQIFKNVKTPKGFRDQYAVNVHTEDTQYLVGPSYAFKVNDKFSLGLTLYSFIRQVRLQQYQYVELNSIFVSDYYNLEAHESGLTQKVGVQYSPIDQISLGLTVTQTGLNSSKTKLQQVSVFPLIINSNVVESSQVYEASSDEKREFPLQISMGVAYFHSPFVLVAADIDFFQQRDDTLEDVINLSLGTEFFIDDTNAFRMGLFTNNTNQPEISKSRTGNNEHLDMNGFSLGYSSYSKTSSVTLGLIYSQGQGDAQIFGDPKIIKDFERESTTMLLSASYSY